MGNPGVGGVVCEQTEPMIEDLPDALIFDFDGLILDTESSAYRSVAEQFVDHGVELDLAEWQAVIGTFDHPHWTEVLQARVPGRLIDRRTLDPVRTRRKLELLEPEQVRPGVLELLESSADAGVALAVASSSPVEWVEPHLERLGLRRYFSRVATRTDVDLDPRRTKPAPDIYLIAVDALGVDPSRTVALEDSPNGVAAARAAGLWCVAVPGPITRGLDFTTAHLELETLAGTTAPGLFGAVVGATVTPKSAKTL